ncbi:MAG: lipase family protein [Acinetobacter bohemicus]
MKKTLLTVLMSSSAILLTACGSGDDDWSFSGGEQIPVNNIQNPVVNTPEPYTESSIATASESVLMTYKMLGVSGKEVQATALVFTPKAAAPVGGWPIVVWAHGTTGVADECAPSRSALNSNVQVMIDQFLAAGYVVVAPDYEGLGEKMNDQLHPFLNLKSESYAITDAVVAARNYLGSKVSKQWMTVGHSQGGHAALGAAEYAVRANLDYKGTVAVAPASHLALILTEGEKAAAAEANLNKKIEALASLDTFTALITAGLRNQNSALQYSQIFKSPTDQIAKNAESDCYDVLGNKFGYAMGQYAGSNSGSLDNYPRTQPNFMNISSVNNFLKKDSQPLQVKISTPIVIYQGELDTTVPKQVTDILVSSDAAKKSQISYRTSVNWDHGSAYVANLGNIVNDVKGMMPTTTPIP